MELPLEMWGAVAEQVKDLAALQNLVKVMPGLLPLCRLRVRPWPYTGGPAILLLGQCEIGVFLNDYADQFVTFHLYYTKQQPLKPFVVTFPYSLQWIEVKYGQSLRRFYGQKCQLRRKHSIAGELHGDQYQGHCWEGAPEDGSMLAECNHIVVCIRGSFGVSASAFLEKFTQQFCLQHFYFDSNELLP